MSITRFVPFRSGLSDVAVLQNRLNSIFQEFARPGGDVSEGSEILAMGHFVPAVDVYEDAQKLVLKLEIPGIRREDLDIRVEGRALTVKGERKFESEEKEENFHRIERRYGSFVRSFTLPPSVNTDEVSATATDGVLTVSLAKKPEAKPKQIEVKVGEAPKQVEAAAKA
ncbi:Hsp20 family protein [Granulicella sp. 5B5]|uniref:Hsp20/alpha crystallin family protein n=1 Tax=Granulicella sp. 5B5 TaxID=1617967 RepID=UPI0015F4B724|nr:Hsp20/alpha crystallin family protein [Granulicella sp. 5B5]QMV18812.1 Hsp20 family protein [Granulicella sp. 5B5]